MIEPGRSYTLSFYAKTDKPELDIIVDVWHLRYSIMKRQSFSLSNKWKRCYMEVPPQDQMRGFYIAIEKQGSRTIWLDDLQFQEGKLTDYHPPEPIKPNIEFSSVKWIYAWLHDCFTARLFMGEVFMIGIYTMECNIISLK